MPTRWDGLAALRPPSPGDLVAADELLAEYHCYAGGVPSGEDFPNLASAARP